MSAKRAATTDLNHENWDQEDPAEHEEMGTFKAASKDVLEKRVIRTAKRRSQMSGGEGSRGVFSSFGGFNKTQPSSFDFLANLTNGNKTNISPKSQSDTAVTSSFFSSKSLISSPGGGLFAATGTTTTAASATKASFGIPTQSSLFGVSSSNTQTVSSIFTASKADSTVGDSSFKTQPISSTTEVSRADITKTSNVTSNVPGSQVTSTLFGVSSTNLSASKSLFSNTNNSSPFKMQPVSSSTTIQSNFGTTSTAAMSKPSLTESNKDTESNDSKIRYYTKLKGLNESVSDWIKKHVEASPLCILSPIFKDYDKYLKEMQEEFQDKPEGKDQNSSDAGTSLGKKVDTEKDTTPKGFSAFATNVITSPKPDTSKLPVFGKQNTASPAFATNVITSPKPGTPKLPVFGSQNTASPAFATNAITSPKPDTPKLPVFGGQNTASPAFATNVITSPKPDTPKLPVFGSQNTASPAFATNVITSPKPDTPKLPVFGSQNTASPAFASNVITSPKPDTPKLPVFGSQNTASPAFATNVITSPKLDTPKFPVFGSQNTTSPFGEKSNFSFGIKPTTTSSNLSNTTAGFSFGISTTPSTTKTASPFSVTSNLNGRTPFSFGTGKPFSFSSNIQKSTTDMANSANQEANEDEPPKVEYTPVVEENSVFEKKCKIFVKKDGNFVDKGVGTLYIKKIEESGKHQLLVRANTSLGNVLVNLVLASAIPTQRMGKNNVMMVCIPTPDSKPPPTSILIRVKTTEEADELLETLNKYKA